MPDENVGNTGESGLLTGRDMDGSPAEKQAELAGKEQTPPVAVSNIQFFKSGQGGESGDYPLALWEPEGEPILEDGVPTLQEDAIPLPGGNSIFHSSLLSLREAAARNKRIDLVPVATP